jgi:SynChlorMet cassette protein ScmC
MSVSHSGPIYSHKTIPKGDSGYCLQLANGQGWHLISTEGVRAWVEKFASIMELTCCKPNGDPNLIFIRRESGNRERRDPIKGLVSNPRGGFPSRGWSTHNLSLLTLWSHNDVPDVICEIGHEDRHNLEIASMYLSLHPIYQRAQDSGGLPFHAALVRWNGIGILLAAPGNSGKSTCCRRLPPPWQALCDDETLIVRDKQKGYLAHPFPTWSDYLLRGSKRTRNVQRHLPVSAIFFLEQAETDEAVHIGQGQAAIRINQSSIEVCRRNWKNLDREEEVSIRKKLFHNACHLARVVPAFKLRVSLNGPFWEEIEKVL